MSYVNDYFYCRIQPEGLLYDSKRDLLAIAQFLDKFRNPLLFLEWIKLYTANLVHKLIMAGFSQS